MNAVDDNSLSRQLDELKTFLFSYIVMAPLLSALFAEHIDNRIVACALFVGLVGGSFFWVRQRVARLEESLREQEQRLAEYSTEQERDL